MCAIVGGVLSQEVIKVNHYFRTVLRENFKKTETAFISEFQGRKKSFWYLGKDILKGLKKFCPQKMRRKLFRAQT